MNTLYFNPKDYGIFFSEIIDPNRINELGPGKANKRLKSKLKSISLEEAFLPNQIHDRNFANATFSGIWLHHDFIDESHNISQNIPSTTGSFWHGIMHRREGDYWNSKYWFRQVEEHPAFLSLQSAILQILEPPSFPEFQKASWDPFLFVDMVQKYIETGSEEEYTLRKIQQLEWQILFDYCFKGTIGII